MVMWWGQGGSVWWIRVADPSVWWIRVVDPFVWWIRVVDPCGGSVWWIRVVDLTGGLRTRRAFPYRRAHPAPPHCPTETRSHAAPHDPR